MCNAGREGSIRDARTQGRDAVREDAMRDARCEMRDARCEGTKTHLCRIICSKDVCIALKTSVSYRLLDLDVFFTSHLADYPT